MNIAVRAIVFLSLFSVGVCRAESRDHTKLQDSDNVSEYKSFQTARTTNSKDRRIHFTCTSLWTGPTFYLKGSFVDKNEIFTTEESNGRTLTEKQLKDGNYDLDDFKINALRLYNGFRSFIGTKANPDYASWSGKRSANYLNAREFQHDTITVSFSGFGLPDGRSIISLKMIRNARGKYVDDDEWKDDVKGTITVKNTDGSFSQFKTTGCSWDDPMKELVAGAGPLLPIN